VDGFEQLRWLLTKAALQGEGVELELKSTTGANKRVLLPLDQLQVGDVSAELYRQIGITAPWSEPVIGELQSGGAALRDGLQPNDRISRLNDLPVLDAASLRQRIRESGVGKAGRIETQRWLIDRPGVGLMELAVTPDWVSDDRGGFGRIGAYVGKMPDMVWVSYPLPQALDMGLARTWDMSALTLRMMGRILTGQASIKNLTGPISIAEYAGKSAQMGLAAFLGFLGVISVSLGVLNLLPIPMLDGGHLMYYLWEWLSGKPVPEPWLDRLQRAGLAVVLLMMSVALFNDVARLLG
jgi:regulator of sigma E protease